MGRIVHGDILPSKLRGLTPRANYTNRGNLRLSAKLLPTFTDRGCFVVSAADPYDRISIFWTVILPSNLRIFLRLVTLCGKKKALGRRDERGIYRRIDIVTQQ
jgi:hypothetical protein